MIYINRGEEKQFGDKIRTIYVVDVHKEEQDYSLDPFPITDDFPQTEEGAKELVKRILGQCRSDARRIPIVEAIKKNELFTIQGEDYKGSIFQDLL